MFIIDEKIEEWKEREQRLGFERGIAKGLAEGAAKGIAEGEARGIAEGEARGIVREQSRLCKLAGRKFGAAVGEELARRLGPVSDAEKLEEVGVLILDCADGAELLARVRPNGGA